MRIEIDTPDRRTDYKHNHYYGADGKAEYDIDFKHGNGDGSHTFPHKHIFVWDLP